MVTLLSFLQQGHNDKNCDFQVLSFPAILFMVHFNFHFYILAVLLLLHIDFTVMSSLYAADLLSYFYICENLWQSIPSTEFYLLTYISNYLWLILTYDLKNEPLCFNYSCASFMAYQPVQRLIWYEKPFFMAEIWPKWELPPPSCGAV